MGVILLPSRSTVPASMCLPCTALWVGARMHSRLGIGSTGKIRRDKHLRQRVVIRDRGASRGALSRSCASSWAAGLESL